MNKEKNKNVKILTNNLEKMRKLEELGVIVEGRVPLEIKPCKDSYCDVGDRNMEISIYQCNKIERTI